MRAWATAHLALLSRESFNRFNVLAKDPKKLDDSLELRMALLDFIADFANWDSATVPEFLATSRSLTQAAHEGLGGAPGTRPLVVDPFAGGGSIPLEALRVGADAFASDLNPVPVLLNKVLLEFIPKYGERLVDDVRKWGDWMNRTARDRLGRFYPDDEDGATPVAYLWARTIISEEPGGDDLAVEVPLLRSMWLSKKKGRFRALRWKRDSFGCIQTDTVERTYADGSARRVRRPLLEVFEPASPKDVEAGTSRGGAATCPITQFTTSVEGARRQLSARRGGASDARLVCVVTAKAGHVGRQYRLPTERDISADDLAARAVRDLETSAEASLIPRGAINHLRGFFNIVLYGMSRWGDLFSPRQQLALVTLTQLVRQAGDRLRTEYDRDRANAIQTCLGLAVSRHADINASLAMWHNTRELITHVFGRQALPMVWDYAEANTFSGSSGAFLGGVDWICRVLDQPIPTAGHVEQASATEHPLPSDSANVVFTDPPYYAAIPYADLSDFFYSWLRPALIDVYPELLHSQLAPKEQECVSLSHRAAMYRYKDSSWFESMMSKAFREARRVDRPDGIGVVVFANKETSGWEAMLAALISSDWTITGSWPIDTELGNRLRARNSAVLASSIHLVCRPRENPDGSVRGDEVGDWREVLAELPRRIHDWMPRLADEGVVGADAIFACLGPALEIFSRYSRVERANGEVVTLREYLEQVWAAVSREALSMIFADPETAGLDEDARLTAMWLWTMAAPAGAVIDEEGEDEEFDESEEDEKPPSSAKTGFALEFDAARKIAQGLGARLETLQHVVEVKGDKARLLSVAERTRYLFGGSDGAPAEKKGSKKKRQRTLFEELEEVAEQQGWSEVGTPSAGSTTLGRVHQAMILFGAGRGEALKRFLVDEGVGRVAQFWKLAQALSALYPPGTDEKRWVDGVLARKKGLGF